MKKIMNKEPIRVENYFFIRIKIIINEPWDMPEDRYESVCRKCGNPVYPKCVLWCDLHRHRKVRLD